MRKNWLSVVSFPLGSQISELPLLGQNHNQPRVYFHCFLNTRSRWIITELLIVGDWLMFLEHVRLEPASWIGLESFPLVGGMGHTPNLPTPSTSPSPTFPYLPTSHLSFTLTSFHPYFLLPSPFPPFHPYHLTYILYPFIPPLPNFPFYPSTLYPPTFLSSIYLPPPPHLLPFPSPTFIFLPLPPPNHSIHPLYLPQHILTHFLYPLYIPLHFTSQHSSNLPLHYLPHPSSALPPRHVLPFLTSSIFHPFPTSLPYILFSPSSRGTFLHFPPPLPLPCEIHDLPLDHFLWAI